MNKRSWLMRLTAFMVVLTMTIGFVGAGYSEDFDVTDEPEVSYDEVTADEPEDVSEPEDDEPSDPEPEEDDEPEDEEPEDEEPDDASDDEPADEPEKDNTVVTELDNPSDSKIEDDEDDEDDDDDGDFDFDEDEDDMDDSEDDFEEFDDDEVGDVSEDLLQQFNNPDSFEQVEFSGSADIELMDDDWDEDWDGRVTLIAQVQDASLSYRLVWEANDHDNRGWFTVGSGNEYSYTLTKDNVAREANREYRVVMFTVD